MKIRNVSLTVRNLEKAVEFYRDILLLPVEVTADSARVTIGASQLTLIAGEQFDGAHHLAFSIPPAEFELAHAWLASRVTLLKNEGSEIILGPADWSSRSLYFLGPEDIILEFIARDTDVAEGTGDGASPRMLSISEVGIGVADVLQTVAMLSREASIPVFYDLSDTFASMGSHDGLLIVVPQDRLWFPNRISHAARGPLTVQLESLTGEAWLELSPVITIVSSQPGK